MKNPNTLLIIVFLTIMAFFFLLAFRNEHRNATVIIPEETIKIKEAPKIKTLPYDNAINAKG